jgi:hypothetical protein
VKVRYKDTGGEAWASGFNMCAMAEVLTGDDSASITSLDVFVNGAWKDMGQAFRDKDIITDNFNSCFFAPPTPEDKERGYTL